MSHMGSSKNKSPAQAEKSQNASKQYKNKILNIHPALLPAFPGIDAQKQAIKYGVKFSGCTVHFVDSGVDTGPIILQSVVSIDEGDTVKTLSDKILRKEHKLYPQAVELLASRKIRIYNNTVVKNKGVY